MLKVADSNILQTTDLAVYLAKPQYQVVLPDYVSMEAYKGDTLKSIQKSMSVLSLHPRQVVILKGTQEICMMRGRNAGLQRRMIDLKQTRNFPKYCRDLEAAKRGDKAVISRLLDLGKTASSNINQIHLDAVSLVSSFRDIQDTYSEEDIRCLRRNKPFADGFCEKLLENTLLTAALLFKAHPKVNKLPSEAEVRNTLIFRFALCMQLLILNWIANGGQISVKAEKLVNDKVDMMLAAYGTFFDGVLTNDKKLLMIYEQACAALNGLFGHHS